MSISSAFRCRAQHVLRQALSGPRYGTIIAQIWPKRDNISKDSPVLAPLLFDDEAEIASMCNRYMSCRSLEEHMPNVVAERKPAAKREPLLMSTIQFLEERLTVASVMQPTQPALGMMRARGQLSATRFPAEMM